MLFFNCNVLRSLPGEFIKLEATDQRDTAGIQCPAEELQGCKVMLLWNLTDKLRNGPSGMFFGQTGNERTVGSPEVGKVKIKRETWNKRSETRSIVGARKQFPVAAMYAITCHKSQGLVLSAVVLHSSKEFVSGLTYVACTRVETVNHLQIVGFDRSQLLKTKPEESVNVCKYYVCDGHCEPTDTTSCCRDHILSEEDLTAADADCLLGDNSEPFDGK